MHLESSTRKLSLKIEGTLCVSKIVSVGSVCYIYVTLFSKFNF